MGIFKRLVKFLEFAKYIDGRKMFRTLCTVNEKRKYIGGQIAAFLRVIRNYILKDFGRKLELYL